MAIAVDASTPARFSADVARDGSMTSASFTAPADALLVACFSGDGVGTFGQEAVISDSGGLTWTERVRRSWLETNSGEGASIIWTARTVSSAARTITITRPASDDNGVSFRYSVKCYVLTGVDVDGTPVDSVTASNEGNSTSNPTNTTNLTPGANGLLIAVSVDWSALGTQTSSNLTLDTAHHAGSISLASGYRTCSSGVALNANFDPPAGTPAMKWCQIIVREAAGGGGRTTRNTRSNPLGIRSGVNWRVAG